jgi:hypothetical protein
MSTCSVGVLIITHPGAGTLTYGALFALVNAVLISTVAIRDPDRVD